MTFRTLALPLLSCLLAAPVAAQDEMTPAATATLVDAGGADVGSVEIYSTVNGLLMRVTASGLPEGWHGFHLHELGDCSAEDFSSAGEHYNPTDRGHGLMAEAGAHAGDLPNIHVAASGEVMADITSEILSLTDGDAPILDGDGSAFIIHENADSYQSEAGAGGRIACGVVEANT